MAIAFCRIQLENILPDTNAATLLAYAGRTARVSVLGGADFTHLPADLLHEEIMAPYDAGPGYQIADIVARIVDEAEGRRFRSLDDRVRWPQYAAHAVLALPPEAELGLPEAIEVSRRMAHRLRRDIDLPVYVAIHDPSVLPGRSHLRNRHAHVVAFLREIIGVNLDRKRSRNLLGPVRKDKLGKAARPETDPWPDIAWALLSELFLEVGATTIVAPIAPSPSIHVANDPQEIARVEAGAFAANRTVVMGDPHEFVRRLLRTRMSIRTEDIERALDRWAPYRDTRDIRERVLTSADVCFLRHEGKVTHITTTSLASRLKKIAEIVNSVKNATRRHWSETLLWVVRGMDADATWRELWSILRGGPTDESEIHEFWFADTGRSNVEGLLGLDDLSRIVRQFSFAELLKQKWRRGIAVVCPHGETMDDLVLLELVERTKRANCTLIFGFNVSNSLGTTLRGLAAHIAARLGASPAPSVCKNPIYNAELLLRAVQIDAALSELEGRFAIRYAWDGAREAGDDRRTVRSAYGREAQPYIGKRGVTSVPRLNLDETAMIAQTDFRKRPPDVVEGDLARVVVMHPDCLGQIKIEHTHPPFPFLETKVDLGNETFKRELKLEVDGKQFSLIPLSEPLTLTQARRLRGQPLRIELTDPERAWSTVVLAARAPGSEVFVDRAIATTRQQLVEVIERGLPSVFPPNHALPRRSKRFKAAGVSDESTLSKKAEAPPPQRPKSVRTVPAWIASALTERILENDLAWNAFSRIAFALQSGDANIVNELMRFGETRGGFVSEMIDAATDIRDSEQEAKAVHYEPMPSQPFGYDFSSEDANVLIAELEKIGATIKTILTSGLDADNAPPGDDTAFSP